MNSAVLYVGRRLLRGRASRSLFYWAAAVAIWALSGSCARQLSAYKPEAGEGLLPPGAAGYDQTLQIRFTGVAGFLLQVGDVAALTDPFYSNPSFAKVLFGKLKTDTARTRKAAPQRLDHVRVTLVGHAHYDHLMDLPALANRLPAGSAICGSQTAARVLAPYALPQTFWNAEAAMASAEPQAAPGRFLYSPDSLLRVYPIENLHAPHLCGRRLYSGVLHADRHKPPQRTAHWPDGQSLSYFIDFLHPQTGEVLFRVFYQDSASEPPFGIGQGAPDNRPADVAILSAALWENVKNYPDAHLAALRPKVVIASHWENFFRSPEASYRVVAQTDLDAFMRRASQAAPNARILLPKPGETYRFARTQ